MVEALLQQEKLNDWRCPDFVDSVPDFNVLDIAHDVVHCSCDHGNLFSQLVFSRGDEVLLVELEGIA